VSVEFHLHDDDEDGGEWDEDGSSGGREPQYTRLGHEFSIYNDDIRRSATKTADEAAGRQPGRQLQ